MPSVYCFVFVLLLIVLRDLLVTTVTTVTTETQETLSACKVNVIKLEENISTSL
jgi:hypothetical protein